VVLAGEEEEDRPLKARHRLPRLRAALRRA
jgi:hypothetical protein